MVTEMKFYNRESELILLNQLDKQSASSGIMTVLTGRRRVGKTVLALHHAQGKRFLYLFIAKKEEHLLCQEFLEEIRKVFVQVPIIGEIRNFKDIFALLLEIAKKENYSLIFDEFQEFFQINPSVYSDIQKLWDLNKYSIKLHIIFIGSVYSLMHKIFEEEKEPLFGRADRILNMKSFSIRTTRKILEDNDIYNSDNLFHFFVLTGYLPKYIDVFIKAKVKNLEDMLEVIFQSNSLFLNEGKNLLITEFGRDYLTYFSILELISLGKTARSEIESILKKDIGGYLQRLEVDYGVIARHRSIQAKPNTKYQKYKIVDNFLNFWFRFVYRYQTAVEIENFQYLKKIVKRDFSTYCGPMLEHFFQNLFKETNQFNEIGGYWEKDNKNEIDVVAINDLEKRIIIAETKLNKSKIRVNQLRERSKILIQTYPQYDLTYLSLGIEDIEKFLESVK